MGEYATYAGSRIKIGTCESMYYLRADQAELVTAERGNVDPIRDAAEIRFRFPFPDEDHIRPGDFEDYGRGWSVLGLEMPADDFEGHGRIQWSPNHPKSGYLVMLPCPQGAEGRAMEAAGTVRWGKNGYNGYLQIVQQKAVSGVLATVIQCGACESAWRLETLDDAAFLLDHIDEQVRNLTPRGDEYLDRIQCRSASDAARWQSMADRVRAGYTNPPAWVKRTARVTA